MKKYYSSGLSFLAGTAFRFLIVLQWVSEFSDFMVTLVLFIYLSIVYLFIFATLIHWQKLGYEYCNNTLERGGGDDQTLIWALFFSTV